MPFTTLLAHPSSFDENLRDRTLQRVQMPRNLNPAFLLEQKHLNYYVEFV